MKVRLLIYFLLANTFIFGQTPPEYPAHEFTVNTGANSGYLLMTHQPVNPLDPTLPSLLMFDANEGHLVFYRAFEPDGDGNQSGTTDFKLLPNGKLAYFRVIPNQGANAFNFGKYYLMDGSFTVVDSVGCDGYPTDGHEIQMTPSGNYLLLCTQDSLMDLSGMTINGITGSDTSTVRAQGIQELTPSGNEVAYWDPFVENTIADMYDDQWAITYTQNNPLLDWTHCNTIEYDNGQILLSSRHFNQIMKIDMAGDSVRWRLGGKRDDYGIGEDLFTGQHDIRRLSNGNYTLYNNAQFAAVQSGRSMEFDLNEIAHTATVVDEYIHDADMFSLAMGSHRKLPNGNTLICYGANIQVGQNPLDIPRVVAVDANDNVNLEFYFDDPLAFCYRAQHAQTLPFTVNRPSISVSNSFGGRKILDAGVKAGYRWNTGQTTRRIIVQPGSTAEDYYCYTPLGDGYVSSEVVTLGGSSKRGASVVESLDSGLLVDAYPNPSNGELSIQVKGIENDPDFQLLDMQGKIVLEGGISIEAGQSIDLSDLPAGMYILEVADPLSGATHRQRIVRQ